MAKRAKKTEPTQEPEPIAPAYESVIGDLRPNPSLWVPVPQQIEAEIVSAPVEQPKSAAPGESAEDFKRRFDDFWKQPHG